MKRWLPALALLTLVIAGCSKSASGGGAAVSDSCVTVMRPFLDAEHDIDSRLGVGLTYVDYSSRVGTAKVAYDKAVAHLSDVDNDCTTRVGKPAEDALNEYVAAYTRWNECIKTATTCTLDSISSELQGHWATATADLKWAEAAMPPA